MLLELFLFKPQSLQDADHLALIGVAVFKFKFMVHAGILLQRHIQRSAGQLLHLRFDLPDTGLQIDNVLLDRQQLLVNGMITVQILMLCQIADGFAFCQNHLAGVCFHFPDDDF